MAEAGKKQEDATIATYVKIDKFLTLSKDDVKVSLKGHKSHLGCTRAEADKVVKTVEDIPWIATIRKMGALAAQRFITQRQRP